MRKIPTVFRVRYGNSDPDFRDTESWWLSLPEYPTWGAALAGLIAHMENYRDTDTCPDCAEQAGKAVELLRTAIREHWPEFEVDGYEYWIEAVSADGSGIEIPPVDGR